MGLARFTGAEAVAISLTITSRRPAAETHRNSLHQPTPHRPPLTMSAVCSSRALAAAPSCSRRLSKAPGAAVCGAAARRCRGRCVVIRAVLHQQHQQPRAEPLKVMSLISAAVDVEAQCRRLEVLAGRSAMIGFTVALLAELLTEQSLFPSIPPANVAAFAAGLLAAVATAAAAAAAANKQQTLGRDIKEAVITSLTAVRRSASSVSSWRGVDGAVDAVLAAAFTRDLIAGLLADDEAGQV